MLFWKQPRPLFWEVNSPRKSPSLGIFFEKVAPTVTYVTDKGIDL
jgi:hypothetical protein